MTSDEEEHVEITDEMVERAIARIDARRREHQQAGRTDPPVEFATTGPLTTIYPGTGLDLSGPPVIQPMVVGLGMRVEVDPQGRITLFTDGVPPHAGVTAGAYQTNQPP